MRLTTAHMIFVSFAIVLFAGYGLWELKRYTSSGEISSLSAGLLALSGTGGLAIYLRAFLRGRRSQ